MPKDFEISPDDRRLNPDPRPLSLPAKSVEAKLDQVIHAVERVQDVLQTFLSMTKREEEENPSSKGQPDPQTVEEFLATDLGQGITQKLTDLDRKAALLAYETTVDHFNQDTLSAEERSDIKQFFLSEFDRSRELAESLAGLRANPPEGEGDDEKENPEEEAKRLLQEIKTDQEEIETLEENRSSWSFLSPRDRDTDRAVSILKKSLAQKQRRLAELNGENPKEDRDAKWS